MEHVRKKRTKKKVLFLPVGSKIPAEELRKILKNHDIYMERDVRYGNFNSDLIPKHLKFRLVEKLYKTQIK